MTREEIEQKMVELARECVMTHDPGIIKQLYEVSSRGGRARPSLAKCRTLVLKEAP
jgi:hypothetical protein